MPTKPNMPKAEYEDLLTVLRPAMNATADVIASDLEAACRECGERLNNAGLVESCLDGGDLMRMYGRDNGKAQDALDAACKLYDYANLSRRICRDVRLM